MKKKSKNNKYGLSSLKLFKEQLVILRVIFSQGKRSAFNLLVITIIIGMNSLGLSAIGETICHFNDTEASPENIFAAASLDFSISASSDFSPNVIPAISGTPAVIANREMNLVNDGSLGFEYNVSVETGGNLAVCAALNLEAKLDDVVKYPYTGSSNALSDFNLEVPVEFSDLDDWEFIVTLTGSDTGLQGEICNFNFVFNGSQIGGSGFYDEEIVANKVSVGYWEPQVVLNEFLPNADTYLEYVEIYNMTGSQIDLSEYYVKADGNTIPIDATTTAAYSGGSTIIPANGWLVITTGGDLINDSSGTITLYNKNDIVVDTYYYEGPEHNVNNTPGGTNNLVAYLPFDGDTDDLSGNGNDGTIYNGASYVSGKINQGLSFDGIDDYVSIPHSTSLDITDKITLEAWVNIDDLPDSLINQIVVYRIILSQNYSEQKINTSEKTQ